MIAITYNFATPNFLVRSGLFGNRQVASMGLEPTLREETDFESVAYAISPRGHI